MLVEEQQWPDLTYIIVKGCVGDLKQEKSENDFNSKKIIGKDNRRIKISTLILEEWYNILLKWES